MIKILPLGGADDIGASCFYINIAGTGILLDCGIHPRKKGKEALPNFEILSSLPLDCVFISHAHQDHIGSLPFLIQKYPHVRIYSTEQTKEIAEITLHNAVNILKQSISSEDDIKPYTHEEINLLVRSMVGAGYKEKILIEGVRHSSPEPINISFHDAGHILGSAGILIEHKDFRLFYTGDINLSDQSIMVGAELHGLKNIDVLIMETTYGLTESEKLGTWESESKRFAKAVNKILNKDGSVLIPVFALGKTQEILSVIHEQMKKGLITETNIYTGGVGREIAKVYDRNRYITRRRNTDFELKDIPQLNLFDIEDYNEFKKNPGIVLASSGMMLPGTASYKLLNFWLKQEHFAIFGIGYMDKETPGYAVINAHTGDEIKIAEYGEYQKVRCAIDRFYFTAHSRREELLKIVTHTNPRQVILVHGEPASKDWIGFNILEKYPHIKVYSAEPNKQIIVSWNIPQKFIYS